MSKQLDEFLVELTTLCSKYNMTIGGCGCCDSPWLIQELDKQILSHGKLSIEDYMGTRLDKYEVEEDTVEF